MPRGRPQKKIKVESDDEYCPKKEIVEDSESIQEQIKISQNKKAKENPYKSQPIQNPVRQRESQPNREIKPSAPSAVNTISLQQIKRRILSQVSGMEGQIDILEQETLRQIYQTLVLPNEENINKAQQQSEEESKPQQRSEQILQMIQEIVQNVPHMREQVETFSNKEIRELFEEVFPDLQASHKMNDIKRTKKLNKIREFLLQKVPQMSKDIKELSEEDLMEVYKQYQEKEMSIDNSISSVNHINGTNGINGMNSAYNKNVQQKPLIKEQLPQQHMPYESYDPISKFTSVKQQNKMGYINLGQPIYHNESFINKIPRKSVPKSQFPLRQPHTPYPIEIHNFHNLKRVSVPPPDQERYARTVIIVHTMEPGFIPTPKPKCRCQCCMRMECEMNDPNNLSEFIQNIIPKYTYK